MYKLVILEDNRVHADALIQMLSVFYMRDKFEIACVLNPTALKAYLDEYGKPDILLADIDLGIEECNGIQLVRELFPMGSPTQVIYVTGFIEYCTRVYETGHIYFLTKPVKADELYAAIARALALLRQAEEHSIFVRVGNSIVRIQPGTIRYIESNRRKLSIVSDQGVIETYAPLPFMAQKLRYGFLQCHKSFLVNMERISELRSDSFLLLSGETVPISQKRYKASRKEFLSHLGNQL